MKTNNSNNITEGLLLENEDQEVFLHVGMVIEVTIENDDMKEETISGKIIKINEETLEIYTDDGLSYIFDLEDILE